MNTFWPPEGGPRHRRADQSGNVPSVLVPTPDGEEGPPVRDPRPRHVLGVIGLVAVVIAWRKGNQAAFRVAAGAWSSA